MQIALKNYKQSNPLFELDGLAIKGQYVKLNIVTQTKLEIDEKHSTPVIICQLSSIEDKLGLMKLKVIRNRFYERLLKSRDPLVFSVGWRRFQSIPIYFNMEDEKRARFMKYTPRDLHCNAMIYGPIVPIHSGVLGVQ